MHWFQMVLIAIFVLDIVIEINAIGRTREPLKPGVVTMSVLIHGLLIVGVIFYWGK